MIFVFPQHMLVDTTFNIREPMQRLAHFSALVTAVHELGVKKLTTADCEKIKPLYDNAQTEVSLVDRRIRNTRNPINTEGCHVFLMIVYSNLVRPLLDMRRYLFVPFDQVDELDEWAKTWASAYASKKKTFEFHKFSEYKKPFKDIPLLSQIYILGHGSPGSMTISTKSGIRMNYTVLADRLKKSGLDPQFWGKIKVYACSAGAAQGNAKAFTELFANHMRGQKYTDCEYFGYNVDLRSPMSFDVAEGKYTSTTKDMDNQQIIATVFERVQEKHKGNWQAYMALPQKQRDDEMAAMVNELTRNWIVTHEKKASTARQQF